MNEPVLLGIRPNVMTLARLGDSGQLAGTVNLVEHVGAESVIAVKLLHAATAHDEEGAVPGEIMITTQGYSDLRQGDSVSVAVDLSEAVLFSRSTGAQLGARVAVTT